MSLANGGKLPSRRTRKSIAIVPNHEAPKPASTSDKENGASRRTRSRSLGPGGLEELNAAVEKDNTFAFGGAGRRRRESTAPPAPPPRSILKAALPLSPIQAIPNFRKRSAPAAEKKPSPSTTTVTVPLMTEEEQQRRERERERAEITAARAERRKSLGNRRVSFAPEATLHTWGKNERIENGDGDLTSSTDNSNAQTPQRDRRQSFDSVTTDDEEHSLPNMPSTPGMPGRSVGFDHSDDSIPSSSPFGSSPATGLPTPNPELDGTGDDSDLSSSDDEDETTMHRTISAPTDDLTGSSMFDAIAEEEMSEEINTVTAPNVMKSFFRKPITVIGSNKRNSVGRAPPPKPVFDEDEDDGGEMTMDITRPVGGLLKTLRKQQEERQDEDDTMGEATMDMTRPVGGFMRSAPQQQEEESDSGEMTMDITRPIGGLLRDAQPSYPQLPQGSDPVESEDVTMDVTMDVTRAIGGILSTSNVSYPTLPEPEPQQEDDSDEELTELSDEDMSMEFTAVIGGIKSNVEPTPAGNRRKSVRRSLAPSRRKSIANDAGDDGDMTMDFTMNVGKILPQAQPKEATPKTSTTPASNRIQVSSAGSPSVMGGEEVTGSTVEGAEEVSTSFDDRLGGIDKLTAATAARKTASPEKAAASPLGRAVGQSPKEQPAPSPAPVKKKRGRPSNAEIAARKAAEEEAAKAAAAVSAAPSPSPVEAQTTVVDTPPSEKRRRGRPSKADIAAREAAKAASSPVAAVPSPTPAPPVEAPQAEQTPVKRGRGRPKKNTLSPVVVSNTPPAASPAQKSPVADVSATPSPPAKKRGRPSKADIAAREAAAAAQNTPTVSRVSPRVAAVQSTPVVAPSPLRNVETVAESQTPLRQAVFNDARTPLKTPLRAADGTPKRRLSSLPFPAKSPARNTTPRRQSILDTSVSFTPMKTVDLLQAIAQEKKERKEEIEKGFEEMHRGFKRALDETLDLGERIEAMTPKKRRAVEFQSPPKPAQTPQRTSPASAKKTGRTPRNRQASPRSSPRPVEVVDENTTKIPLADSPQPHVYDGPKLSVEDFCKETEITFLDTLTAKRRQTGATIIPRNSSGSFTGAEANPSLADRIVSSASTNHLLNMYVHGCRELKNHVHDYKRNLRVLEQEANEDMPMIMQEFATATPQGQAVIKTMMGAMKKFSRSQAKSEWYVWRGNLCEQLTIALKGELKDLQDDLERIKEWRSQTTEPAKLLTETQIKLQDQATKAVELKEKINQTDPEVLKASREKLAALRAQLEEKSRRVAELQTQCEADERAEKEMAEKHKALSEENDELKKAHEANRMMKADEIKLYKAKIDKYAETTKWRVHKCTSKAIELTFDNVLLLTLPLNGSKSVIGFLPNTDPTEAETILLQLINSIIPDRSPTNADRRRLTSRISTFWTHVATPLSANTQKLNRLYRLRTTTSAPFTISTTLKLVLPEIQARVDVTFINQFAPDLSAFETSMSASFAYKSFDVSANILKRMKEGRALKPAEDWMGVVRSIREKVRGLAAEEKENAKEVVMKDVGEVMVQVQVPPVGSQSSQTGIPRKKRAIPVPVK